MKLHKKIEHYDKVFHAQELGSYAQGQGSLAVLTRSQPGIKVIVRDLRGHLLHTVTFLVFFFNLFFFVGGGGGGVVKRGGRVSVPA